jgi:hypothetical protein
LLGESNVEAVDKAMDKIIERLLPDLNAHFKTLEGKDFGFEENTQLAKSITRLLRRLGCCLECPKCRMPAVSLRYAPVGQKKTPVFTYEHKGIRRHGGTIAVNTLKIVLRTGTVPHDLRYSS